MMEKSQYTDVEIIEKINYGEIQLYEILIRRYNPYLYKIGRSYKYGHEDTQDLMQDAFVSAFFGLPKFENRSGFKTWLSKIMLNNCYRKTQKASYKNESNIEIPEHASPLYPTDADTEKTVMNRELHRVIENALTEIPENYRMVFTLREINGMNVAETADILEISESNVKVRLNRAKSMLRNEIEKSYSADEIFEFNLVYCDAIVAKVMARISAARMQPSKTASALRE